MKWCPPCKILFLVSPYRSMWTISNGCEVVRYFTLKLALVCFPCWQCLQTDFRGFMIFVNPLTTPFLLTFIIFSKLTCPILLCHNQISSIILMYHCSSFSRMHTSLEFLTTIRTSLHESFFLFFSNFTFPIVRSADVPLITCLTYTKEIRL